MFVWGRFSENGWLKEVLDEKRYKIYLNGIVCSMFVEIGI